MLLLIDNYDSFTYNLVHYLGELGQTSEVRRNDIELSLSSQLRRRFLRAGAEGGGKTGARMRSGSVRLLQL